MPIFMNGLTHEKRTVTDPEDVAWYSHNPPWYLVKSVLAPEAYPPSERAAKATKTAKPKA